MQNIELLAKTPLSIKKEIENEIGLNGAVILQKLHFWLEKNKKEQRNYIDGKFWTYNSIRAWQEDYFYYLSFSTVKRAFAKLEKAEYIISANFNKDTRDRTKWYTINYDKLNILLLDVENKFKKLIKNKTRKEKTVQIEKHKISEKTNKTVQSINKMSKEMKKEIELKSKIKTGKYWPDALGHVEPMDWVKVNQPLPLTNTIYNSSYIYPSSIDGKKERGRKEDRKDNDYKKCKENLRKKLGYYDNVQCGNVDIAKKYDNIINVLTDVMMLDETDTVKINGNKMSAKIIKEKFRLLNQSHMKNIIFAFENNEYKIKNPRAYLLTVAYNAVTFGTFNGNVKGRNIFLKEKERKKKFRSEEQAKLDIQEEDLYVTDLLIRMMKEEEQEVRVGTA